MLGRLRTTDLEGREKGRQEGRAKRKFLSLEISHCIEVPRTEYSWRLD